MKNNLFAKLSLGTLAIGVFAVSNSNNFKVFANDNEQNVVKNIDKNDLDYNVSDDNSITINGFKDDFLDSIENKQIENLEIPSKIDNKQVTRIDDNAFSGMNIDNLKIENGIKEIGGTAFQGNNLSSLNLPNSVESIEDDAFSDNINLNNVTLPNNLKSLGDYTFTNTNISSLELPESLENLGRNVFGADEIDGAPKHPSLTNTPLKIVIYNNDQKNFLGEKSYSNVQVTISDKPFNKNDNDQGKSNKDNLDNRNNNNQNDESNKDNLDNRNDNNQNDESNKDNLDNRNDSNKDIFDTSIFYNNDNSSPFKNESKSRENTSSKNNIKNNDNIADKNISKNKTIFHKYTKSFKIMKKNGQKDYNATNFKKNNSLNFLLSNDEIVSSDKYIRTYQQNNNVKKVRVVNNEGITVYKDTNFNKDNRVKHVAKNKTFKIDKIKHLNYDVTRYKLLDGTFITANNHFVKPIK